MLLLPMLMVPIVAAVAAAVKKKRRSSDNDCIRTKKNVGGVASILAIRSIKSFLI
jgi:hypothetical protein